MEAVECPGLGPLGSGMDLMVQARRIVLELGERAGRALAGPALESERFAIDRNLSRVAEDLHDLGEGAFPESVVGQLSRVSCLEGMHLAKIPPRIAGASLVTARFGRAMTTANRRRAYVAKALYECQQDLLDDILDGGTYSFLEARGLYTYCAEGALAPVLDRAVYEEGLVARLKPPHRRLAPVLAEITFEFHRRIHGSPSAGALLPSLADAADRLATGQAATILLRRPTLDFAAARVVGSELGSPDPGAPWYERLAAHASWAVDYSLIDLCFTDRGMSAEALSRHLAVWYDLNVEISYIDHVAGLEKDLRDGIFNLAWAAIRDGPGGLDAGAAASIPQEDRGRLAARAARFARRAVARDEAHGGADGFYPFLAILIPVVLTATGVGNEPWVLEAFLRAYKADEIPYGGGHPIGR